VAANAPVDALVNAGNAPIDAGHAMVHGKGVAIQNLLKPAAILDRLQQQRALLPQ
jgi:hypothetical protein